ncbi:uncharacterized protein BP5553_03617 [Venustampulla echinocandica]|uniref:HIT-type domain-containing protein n=1 Tax=Venustampulla echinocandica TaxID=2656787 RepID=A0A370TUR6_9HELO|nr:uncharacterized protein BP5553_03617 [Venustampulla echinocandica]RDL39277.1 hypothetical protein BP5553_03617 [Venustampulla echinocandica]
MSLPGTATEAPKATTPPTEPAAAEYQSQQDTTSGTKVSSPVKKLCGVCNDRESKYKCSRCYLPYCSVACSTVHKTTHPADEPAPVASTPIPSPPAETHGRAGTRAAAGSKGPFAPLDNSEELQELFKTYPRLKSHLQNIHNATLPPADDHAPSFPNGQQKRRGGKQEAWNQDRGLQNGVKALNRARVAYGKDGEGVREFSKLVLQMVSRDAGGVCDATDIIQKEIEEENARIISMLLNHEI